MKEEIPNPTTPSANPQGAIINERHQLIRQQIYPLKFIWILCALMFLLLPDT